MNSPAAMLVSSSGSSFRVARGVVRRDDDQHVLINVVVEGAERLRAEEGQEASLLQPPELDICDTRAPSLLLFVADRVHGPQWEWLLANCAGTACSARYKLRTVYSMQSSASIALVRDNLSDSVVLKLRHMIITGSCPRAHASTRFTCPGNSRSAALPAGGPGPARAGRRIAQRRAHWLLRTTVDRRGIRAALRHPADSRSEALRLAGLPSRERMEKLQDLNDAIGRARDSDTIINLDDEFHMELIAACPNQVLIELIRQIVQRTRRYEIGLMRESRNVAVATANHKEIMMALRKRDLRSACAALRNNLRTGREPILAWLKARPTA